MFQNFQKQDALLICDYFMSGVLMDFSFILKEGTERGEMR